MKKHEAKLTIRLPRALLIDLRRVADWCDRSINFVVLKALSSYIKRFRKLP